MKAVTIKNWKKLLEPENWHPASNMFPLWDDAELAGLVESIKAEGLKNPIILFHGKVLDGRNRLRACELAGVLPSFMEWESSDGDSPETWVAAQNAVRRNLSQSQKAYAALYIIKNIQPTAEQKKRFVDGGRKWDRRIWICNMFGGLDRHYVSDIVDLDRWCHGESWDGKGKKWRWAQGASRPRLDILENIKSGVHSISSTCRLVEFFIAQAKDPTITHQEVKDCPTGQLASAFMALMPKHIMKKAYTEAAQWLKGEKLARLQRYWERMDTEYTWNQDEE
jgi:ParB-like nuclease domain